MDAVHKLITFFTSPFTLGLAFVLVSFFAVGFNRNRSTVQPFNRSAIRPFALALRLSLPFLWLWLWSTALVTRWIGLPLEAPYPPVAAEQMPTADAICILGGGMAANTNNCVYPEMSACADRVWHGARLYKAGKAPIVTLSGGGVRASTVPLLRDFGVPESAFVYLDRAKNTEDEAALIAEAIKAAEGRRVKVLLVTSAWHMRRAEYLFRRAGLEVIPAPTDYVASLFLKNTPFAWGELLPNAECLSWNSCFFKEHFAYWCYRVRGLL